jgi:alpha-mannosidase
MSTEDKFRVPKLRRHLALIEQRIIRGRCNPERLEVLEPAPPTFGPPADRGEWRPVGVRDHWGGKQQWAYFRATVAVPSQWGGPGIELRIEHDIKYFEPAWIDDSFPAGPEGQVFIDGQRVGAIDAGHSRIRHRFAPGKTHDIRAVFFAARCDCRHMLKRFDVVQIDLATEKLYNDLKVALDVADHVDEASVSRVRLIRAVEAGIHALDVRELIDNIPVPADAQRDRDGELFYASVARAQDAFDARIAEIPPYRDAPRVCCVGHAHIDLAWLWPLKQTRHKCVRTFATQLRLIDQYEGFVFQQSSPQAYAWIEQDAPDLFEKIRQRVAEGTWEADGATWVEMDTNLVSGESFVRQLLYGKRYYRDKFDFESRMLWLPDVFGYSAALPQILRLAGVDTFVTQKISWNQFNRFPHQTFRWRGIDGSEVVTHFPLDTYNGLTVGDPIAELKRDWDQYTQKRHLIEPLLPFGWGDGGGGPTEEQLELLTRLERMPAVPGIPKPRRGKAGELLRSIAARAAELPVWDGELYLEYHRGTYTTQAWLKRANRKNEIRLHQLEWLAALARPDGYKLDKARLDDLWKDLLLLQFHDILPGSSVGEVYDEVRPMQQRVTREADAMIAEAADVLTGRIETTGAGEPIVLFNTLSWDRTDPVRLPDGTWRDDITVPAGGWTVVDAKASAPSGPSNELSVSKDGRTLRNRFWQIDLGPNGEIVNLYDRTHDRRLLREGACANQWQVFSDRPLDCDAWDIDVYYEDHPLPGPTLDGLEVAEQGPARVAVELTWSLPPIGRGPQSRIVQRLAIYGNHPRIDFETRADWHEHHQLLKVAFPVDICATEAAYEIQFGHVRRATHRNTSWDVARFEVCAHRFVDLAEHGYGVALLNDCKYGHDVHEGVIRLTCIKCAQAPDASADQGAHVFNYALLPHAGTFQDAGVVRAAAEFNNTTIIREAKAQKGGLPPRFAPIQCEDPAVVIDTLKPAEDGQGLILRLYEAHGSHAKAALTFAEPPKEIRVVDVLEEPLDDGTVVAHARERVTLALRPFQVVSLRVVT